MHERTCARTHTRCELAPIKMNLGRGSKSISFLSESPSHLNPLSYRQQDILKIILMFTFGDLPFPSLLVILPTFPKMLRTSGDKALLKSFKQVLVHFTSSQMVKKKTADTLGASPNGPCYPGQVDSRPPACLLSAKVITCLPASFHNKLNQGMKKCLFFLFLQWHG